jgi:hypothetical protein
MSEKFRLLDVFTPTRPARASFIERGSINTKLVNALQTPGMQVVVYGHTGSGKSTLVENKLCQLYEDHLTTRCIAKMTFDQIVRDAFDQLGRFYHCGTKVKTSSSINAELAGDYLGVKATLGIESTDDKEIEKKRILPPELTPQRLGQYIGAAGCCWIIEDFHKIDASEKKPLSQVMKVFMDLANDWPTLKIIAIGAVDTARQVVEYDPEMRNRVAEIEVPLMSQSELRNILEKGEELLNVEFGLQERREITQLSNGLASVCHSLGLNACRAIGIVETTNKKIRIGEQELSQALRDYISDSSDTLKGIFDKALYRKKHGKHDNFRIVIHGLSKLPQEGGHPGEIFDCIREGTSDYPRGNLKYCLDELRKDTRGELVRYDPNSGKYSFSNPLYRAFALALFSKDKALRKEYVIRTGGTFVFDEIIASLLEETKANVARRDKGQ